MTKLRCWRYTYNTAYPDVPKQSITECQCIQPTGDELPLERIKSAVSSFVNMLRSCFDPRDQVKTETVLSTETRFVFRVYHFFEDGRKYINTWSYRVISEKEVPHGKDK